MRPVYVDRTIHCRHLGSSLCNPLLPHSIFLRRARLWAAQVSGLVMSAVSVIAPPKSLSISLTILYLPPLGGFFYRFAAVGRFFTLSERNKTMKLSINLTGWLLAVLLVLPVRADNINIVGSSTVYPFATIAAERFSQSGDFSAPKIESTGSGGGMKLFCKGVGLDTPSVTNSSRRMKKSEQQLCAQNGVGDVLEVKIGYDGIVVAQSLQGEEMALDHRQLFLALAKQTPGADGALSDNPNKTWQDVDASLPPVAIKVYGPPPTSGTRDAFVELAMENGCSSFAELQALKKSDKNRFKAVCHGLREDGGYIDQGENDNIIIQKLASNPDTLGIFGYSFLEENRDKVRGIPIENVAPTFDAIADGEYPVSRPLFFYVKLAHYGKVAGLQEFVEFFVDPEVMGEDGFLSDSGLIPLPANEYNDVADAISSQRPMESL